MTTFYEIYKEQKDYNERIREANGQTKEEWTQTYLLGLVSEIDDILDSLNWKRHRRQEQRYISRANLRYDLADLTKFILSLWELWGFDPDAVLKFVHEKNQVLDEMFRQEFETVPTDKLVVITDLDGTLGDWRGTFIDWALALKSVKMEEIKDSGISLQIDSDLSMRYPDYFLLKEEFESGGNYRTIKPYPDSSWFLHWAKQNFEVYIIAVTARPWQKYNRIWGDTWQWIVENDLPIDQLRVGSESRILLANDLGGENVIMLEDDPGLMLRAALSGITVIARKHGYNSGVRHELIHKVDSLTEAKGIVEKCYREKVNLTK